MASKGGRGYRIALADLIATAIWVLASSLFGEVSDHVTHTLTVNARVPDEEFLVEWTFCVLCCPAAGCSGAIRGVWSQRTSYNRGHCGRRPRSVRPGVQRARQPGRRGAWRRALQPSAQPRVHSGWQGWHWPARAPSGKPHAPQYGCLSEGGKPARKRASRCLQDFASAQCADGHTSTMSHCLCP